MKALLALLALGAVGYAVFPDVKRYIKMTRI